jgi:preprotein translocase subunit YajC
MSFFITEAWADAAPAAASSVPGISNFLFLGVLLLAFYFMLVRPQSKREKERQKMISALAKGDEVLTSGGLLGKITQLGETYVEVELADNIKVKIQRQAIASVMPKGTLNSL